MTGKVTGIGGVFFTCPDPDALRAWYLKHLGLAAEPGGGIWFDWLNLRVRDLVGTERPGLRPRLKRRGGPWLRRTGISPLAHFPIYR